MGGVKLNFSPMAVRPMWWVVSPPTGESR